MQEVYVRMSHLAQMYENDFCARWKIAFKNMDLDQGERAKVEYLTHLQAIHGWTTAYFASDVYPSKFYLDLVSEHIKMAFRAARLAFTQELPDRAKIDANSTDPCGEEDSFSDKYRETGHMYVDHIPDIVAGMRERGYKLLDREISKPGGH